MNIEPYRKNRKILNIELIIRQYEEGAFAIVLKDFDRVSRIPHDCDIFDEIGLFFLANPTQ